MKGRIQNVSPQNFNGIHYRSKLEATVAKMFVKLGIPFEYEKRRITLLDSFYSVYQKRKVESITYTPDFELPSNIMVECKGFETPEWKLKKKLLFQYLQNNEKEVKFYQIHTLKELIEMLDKHWLNWGYMIKAISKKRDRKTKKPILTDTFTSIEEALTKLSLLNKSKTPIFRVLLGEKEIAYNYNWKLIKLNL